MRTPRTMAAALECASASAGLSEVGRAIAKNIRLPRGPRFCAALVRHGEAGRATRMGIPQDTVRITQHTKSDVSVRRHSTTGKSSCPVGPQSSADFLLLMNHGASMTNGHVASHCSYYATQEVRLFCQKDCTTGRPALGGNWVGHSGNVGSEPDPARCWSQPAPRTPTGGRFIDSTSSGKPA
jgi:hypothetical protein